MKNSTYNESRVVALSLTLPEIDPTRFDAMYDKMVSQGLDETCYNASYGIYDLYYNQAYISVLDARLGYQVIRHFICECRMRYNRMSEEFRYTEVCQHWLCPDGEVVVMAKSRRNINCGWDGNLWWFGSRMSIKHGDYGYIFSHICQDLDSDERLVYIDGIDPSGFYRLGQFVLPRAVNKTNYSHRTNQFSTIFGEIGEWLIKSNHIDLLDKIINREHYLNEVKRRKPQIKIAYRNGLNVADLDLYEWFKYIDSLEEDGKDIHNPHYICDTERMQEMIDVREAAQRARLQAEAAQRAAAEAERQRRIDQYLAEHPEGINAEDNAQARYLIARELEIHEKNRQRLHHLPEWEEEYAKAKRAYIGIGFSSADGTINFHVLKSVEEFFEEAEAMVHCLFYNTCNYFERKDRLILSARDAETDERIATIELNLKTLEVVQIKAKYDQIPDRFNDIQSTIYNNIGIIKHAKIAV